MSTLRIKGGDVQAVSPEKVTASMPLTSLLEKIGAGANAYRSAILPDGVKSVVSQRGVEIWIHQTTPQAHNFRWIATDSPAPYGKGTVYRTVRIALPYLITVAVFKKRGDGQLSLSKSNECFFSNEPVSGWENEMCFPALLNCSKFKYQEGKPLSWICTQHINRDAFESEPDTSKRMRLAFGELTHCLLEAGFNYSSEHHEFNSWYSESKSVDPRIETVEQWEEATQKDELFALEVPWLKTGMNLGQIVDRIFGIHRAKPQDFSTADAVARIVFNHRPETKGPAHPVGDLFDNPFESNGDIAF